MTTIANNTLPLSEIIRAAAHKRIEVRDVLPRRGEILLAVIPDADADDCHAEAVGMVARLYSASPGVSWFAAEGWEGGAGGPRDYVLVTIGGRIS